MIFVIAGHNERSQGALGYDGVYEHTRNVSLQRQVTLGLSSMSLSGTAMEVKTEDEDKSNAEVRDMIRRYAKPHSRGMDIHFNNNFPGATGTEVVISPYTSENNRRRAEWTARNLSLVMGIPVRRRADRDYIYPSETFVGRLPIIESTPIPMMLVEVCFQNDIDLPQYDEYRVSMVLRRAMLLEFEVMPPDIYFNDLNTQKHGKTI